MALSSIELAHFSFFLYRNMKATNITNNFPFVLSLKRGIRVDLIDKIAVTYLGGIDF